MVLLGVAGVVVVVVVNCVGEASDLRVSIGVAAIGQTVAVAAKLKRHTNRADSNQGIEYGYRYSVEECRMHPIIPIAPPPRPRDVIGDMV